jgi:hypothetical protein
MICDDSRPVVAGTAVRAARARYRLTPHSMQSMDNYYGKLLDLMTEARLNVMERRHARGRANGT